MPLTRLNPFFLAGVALTAALLRGTSAPAQSLVLPHEPTFLTLLEDGPLPGYAIPISGEWKVKGEAFVATTKPDETRRPALRIETEMSPLMVVEFKFRFGDWQESSFSIRCPGTRRTFGLEPHCCWVKVAGRQEKPARVCGLVSANLRPDVWHTARIEIMNEHFALTINEKLILRGKDPAFEKKKTRVYFLAGGNGGGFKEVKLWRGQPFSSHVEAFPEIAPLPLATFRFLKCDCNHDGVLSLPEYRAARRHHQTEAEITANFKSLDKNGDQTLSREEFSHKNQEAPAEVSGKNSAGNP